MNQKEVIYFASGCFWCTEAVFQRVEGVISVCSGYIDGKFKNPAYREVCTGRTGHAECVEIIFDPSKVSLENLLTINFATHDPTQLNGQGYDLGTQYRSGVYCTSKEQLGITASFIDNLKRLAIFDKPIVTEVKLSSEFFRAEEEHQNYYNAHPTQRYCQLVIAPKLDKLQSLDFQK